MKAKSLDEWYAELEQEYARWQTIYTEGGNDPFWADGMGLELTRNHIIYEKNQIDELFPNASHREAYDRPLPPKIDRNYMARPDRIRQAAKQKLAILESNPNYLYLKEHAPRMPPGLKKSACIDAVLGYMTGLRIAIETDDVVAQRRYGDADGYLNSFERAVQKVQAYQPSENEQLSLFYDSGFDDNEESEELTL